MAGLRTNRAAAPRFEQVVRTTGMNATLLVLPEMGSFEAWRMLLDDRSARSVTFEGWYALMMHRWAPGAAPCPSARVS